jgi:hypothetical protein
MPHGIGKLGDSVRNNVVARDRLDLILDVGIIGKFDLRVAGQDLGKLGRNIDHAVGLVNGSGSLPQDKCAEGKKPEKYAQGDDPVATETSGDVDIRALHFHGTDGPPRWKRRQAAGVSGSRIIGH